MTGHNEKHVPPLAACAFPGKTSLLNGAQFIVSRRALLQMPLWLALVLAGIGMSSCSKGTTPSRQMGSCAGMCGINRSLKDETDGKKVISESRNSDPIPGD